MNAHVLVLGIGGVGSNCTEALARGGVGKLTILDRDVVEESNINRQSIAFYSTLGKRKVDVMEAMIKDIDPEAQVKKVFGFLRQEEMESFLDEYARDVDYVVDAIDTISAKLKLAELAPNYSFKLISSMGGANKIHPECFKIADLYDTVNCPLCRIMRKEGRKRWRSSSWRSSTRANSQSIPTWAAIGSALSARTGVRHRSCRRSSGRSSLAKSSATLRVGCHLFRPSLP